MIKRLVTRIANHYRERALWAEAFRIREYLENRYPDADRDGDTQQSFAWHGRRTHIDMIRFARAPIPDWVRKGPRDPGRPWNG